jgi:hypothetical protein
MNNKKLIVLIVLAVLAVLSIVYGLVKSSRETARMPEKLVESSNKAAAVNKVSTVLPSTPPVRSAYSSWGRNPFALPGERYASLEDLRLEGVLSDKNKFSAIINDRVVIIGEEIEGNTVVDIRADRVILSDGQKEFELKLNQ